MSTAPPTTPPKNDSAPLKPKQTPENNIGMSATMPYAPKKRVEDVASPLLHDMQTSTSNVGIKELLSYFLELSYSSPNNNPAENSASLLDQCLKAICDRQRSNEAEFTTIKKGLETYCSQRAETARYAPFVEAANHALKLLATVQITGFRGPDNDNPIVFQTNDKPIKGIHEETFSHRKPDVVLCNFTELRADLLPDEAQDTPLDDYCNLYAPLTPGTIAKGATLKSNFSSWDLILSSLEFKMKNQTLVGPPSTYSSELKKIIEPQTVPNQLFENEELVVPTSTAPSATSSEKRKRVQSGSTNNEGYQTRSKAKETGSKTKSEEKARSEPKAAKTALGQDAPSSSRTQSRTKKEAPAAPAQIMTLRPMVQCALYAAEMLSRKRISSHVINVLVIDDVLHIWYQDREGFIQSHGINFVQDLPYFMVLLFALQRFQTTDFGIVNWINSGKDEDTVFDVGGTNITVNLGDNAAWIYKSFTIVGRSTTVLRGIWTDATSNAQNECVVKISYPESVRIPEGDIVDMARARAHVELVGLNRTSVVNHLPELIASQDYPGSSIRQALKMPVPENARRIRRITVWKPLQSIYEVYGEEFWKAFWECYMCHYHLYKLEISHGDISDGNLMYNPTTKKGVLNDFDLAIDTRDKNRMAIIGNRRTGTTPFLSLRLFEANHQAGNYQLAQNIERQYFHSEESFRWVLVWLLRRGKPGKKNPVPPDLQGWLKPETTYAARRGMAGDLLASYITTGNFEGADLRKRMLTSARYMLRHVDAEIMSESLRSKGRQSSPSAEKLLLQLKDINDSEDPDCFPIPIPE